jgi:DNA-directed RNA polymerase subunit RPC12/RpoP
MTETHLGIQIFYDFVGPTGSQIQYGMMNPTPGEEWIGLSDRITTGKNHLSSIDRSPLSDQTIILSWNEIHGWEIRSLIDDNDPDRGELNLLDEMRIYLGLDEQNFAILMAGISITVLLLCLLVLTTMSLNAVKWVGRRRRVGAGNIILEDDVVDIVEPTDLEIKSSEIELIEEKIDDPANLRKQRRNSRKISNQLSEQSIPIPRQPLPLPSTGEIQEIPQINRTILCPECSARFDVSSGLKMIKCPICESRISL